MGVGSSEMLLSPASITRTVSVLAPPWLEGTACWASGDPCMLGTPLGPAEGAMPCACAIPWGTDEPGGSGDCAFANGGKPGTAFTPD